MIWHPTFEILGEEQIQELNNVETAYAIRITSLMHGQLAFHHRKIL